MACVKCDHKGFIESYAFRDGGMKPIIVQCSHCRDVAAYSRRVQEIRTTLEKPKCERPFVAKTTCQVLPFKPRDKKK